MLNRALPDAELDAFVEALATRISGFDKWAIANTKRLVNTSLPPDVELGAGWDHGSPRSGDRLPGRHPSTDGARLSPTWRGGKSSWVLPRPNQTVIDNRAIWRAGPLAVAEGFEPSDGGLVRGLKSS